jgi:hypothetical protein
MTDKVKFWTLFVVFQIIGILVAKVTFALIASIIGSWLVAIIFGIGLGVWFWKVAAPFDRWPSDVLD